MARSLRRACAATGTHDSVEAGYSHLLGETEEKGKADAAKRELRRQRRRLAEAPVSAADRAGCTTVSIELGGG